MNPITPLSVSYTHLLANQGIPCVGIPGTIDNDIACSEYTIGYDTAMNTAVEAIDKLRDTTQSHDRCSVVEVMGHHAGYIALNVGIATGALAVLLPERPFDFERDILQRMRQTQVTGKKHFIIIVSEGVTDAQTLANQIQAATGVDSVSYTHLDVYKRQAVLSRAKSAPGV